MPQASLFATLALVWLASVAQAADVSFSGSTTVVVDTGSDGKPLAEKDVRFVDYEGAQVTAFRRSMLNKTVTGKSGEYGMSIDAGHAIILLFDGGGELKPELKLLTADPKKPQQVHVTLLTYNQYVARFGREALIDDVRRILHTLRKMEGFDTKDLEKRLERFDIPRPR